MSGDEAVAHVMACKASGMSARAAASKLVKDVVDRAIRKEGGDADNTSAIVAYLE